MSNSPLIWNGPVAKLLTGDIKVPGSAYDNLLLAKQTCHIESTGLESGGILSINGGDNTKFDLSAGNGNVIDYSVPNNPTIKNVSWNAFTAQTVTGLATQDVTWIMINNAGAIVQLSNFPTADQRRLMIFVGRLGHTNHIFLTFANTIPDFSQSPASQFYDFVDALGPFNISGNQIATNGANLTFQKSAGSMFFRGYNYATNIENPHVVSIPSNAPVSFQYFLRSGPAVSTGTNVDPANYDVAGVLTPIPGGTNESTIQRVFLAPNNVVIIQYGQTVYANLTDAIAAIGVDPFIINPNIPVIAILIGYIVLRRTTTALNDVAFASLLPSPRFSVGAGGGVNPVTSLQQTYNSSTSPEIVLNSTLGGLDINDNATPIGGYLFKISNNAGGANYLTVSATAISTTLPVSSGTITANLVGNVTGTVIGPAIVNAQTGTTYTVLASDANQVITLTNASPITLTIPNTLAVGTRVDVYQGGAGQITFVGSGGMNVFNALSLTTSRTQYSGVTMVVTATNTTILTGDLF